MAEIRRSGRIGPAASGLPVAWETAPAPVPYPKAVARMEALADAIAAGTAPERVWLIEHPPIYTGGTSAKAGDVRDAKFPVFASGRGGQFTYHGPGQRVVYVMLDLKRRKPDVRAFVCDLESWLIDALAALGVAGERRAGRVGIWVARAGQEGREDKIAAIGVRVRRWVTFHGVSLNVDPDLSHYRGIVPCGIDAGQYGVTSLADLGKPSAMTEVDTALRRSFEKIFGPTAAD